ncbi:MAG: hypothetical protein HQ541_13285 [Mariniphaga sp.]|nr:hypothetical protein [Mariniphaga sp.]
MNLKEIKAMVANIDSAKDDDEMAHCAEDDLREDFIKHISKTGTKEQRKMAREILKTNDIDFSRWFA